MTAPRDERPVADVLDEIHLRDIADELDAMSPEERARELEKVGGFDADSARKRIEAARAAAEGEAGASKATSGKLVDLAEMRERRARRLGMLSVAAIVALALGGSGTWKASTYMPPRTVEYPTEVAGPPRPAVARALVERGLRECKEGYFEECRDDLDRAHVVDPASDAEPDAIEARKAIADEAKRDKTPSPDSIPNAKHGPARGERPLQPLR